MKHFRPTKGWKKELEDVSLTLVLIVLVIVAMSAKAVAASSSGGGGMIFWGRILVVQGPCYTTVVSGIEPKPCQKVGDHLLTLVGRTPQLEIFAALSRGTSKYPKPQGWILGFMTPGAPPTATTFWMY